MSGKKRNAMLFVLLFTLLLGVIVPVQAQSDGRTKTIRVAYREDADFINKSSSGVYKGYGVEYLNKISQYTGWRYERPGRIPYSDGGFWKWIFFPEYAEGSSC